MATNPLGIFQAALANGPHTEPIDVGQEMANRVATQAQAAEMQQRAGQIALANRREALEQKADQAMRDALKANTKSIPVGPPPPNFPPPPNMGLDDEGNPLPPPPDYKQAQAAAAVNVPKTDFYGAAAQLAAQGYGDRALTMLKTHAELSQKELDNAKQALANQQERNSAIGQRIGGLLQAAKPQGDQGPVDPAGVQHADQQWPALRRELIEQYGENPQNLPEHFDPSWADPYFASKVGVDKANKAVMDHLEQQGKVAETKEAGARAGALEAQAGLQTEQTKRMTLQRQMMEQAAKDPNQAQAAIDELTKDDPELNKQAHAAYIQRMQLEGPEGASKVVGTLFDQVAQKRMTVWEATNPAVRGAKIADAVKMETAKQIALQKLNPDALSSITNPQLRTQAATNFEKDSKEYADKLGAVQQANDLIGQAQKGNKAAPGVIPIAQVRQFTNRVNTQELRSVSSAAGDAADRIQGFFSKYTEGEPIPANVMADMRTVNDAMAQAARRTYAYKVQITNKTTGSKFEPIDLQQEAPKAAPSTSQYQKGQQVMYQGKPHTILDINKDGKLVLSE